MSDTNFFQFTTQTIQEKEFKFFELRGKKAILVVNTASKCGFTPQYEDLQEIYGRYKDKGLEILAFPSNDFGGQEPGSHTEIAEFCSSKGVTFPLMAKSSVSGASKNPIFDYLVKNSPESELGEVKWNFEKFLVDGEGRVKARFRSAVKPTAEPIVQAIETLLANQ